MNPSSSSSSSSSSSRPSTSTTTQACAACKYQRRKCNPDCPLAPYFPADHQRQFLNAHRLFGVSNILKIIRGLDPVQRAEAMRSIIFQSNARAHDPVGGCYRIILELERQYERDCSELALVLRQLALYRAQTQHELPPNFLVNDNEGDADDAIYGSNLMMQQQQQQYYDYFYYDGGGGGENNDNDNNNNNNNNISISNSNSVNNNNNGNEVELEMPQSMLGLQQQQQCGVVEDDVKPLIDMFDVRQALAIGDDEEEDNSKAADAAVVGSFHCSNEMESKEEPNPMEHVQEHDLKGAASLFTLTSRNSSYV